MIIKQLTNTVTFNQQDGSVLDFRNQGMELFVIDRASKILKPNGTFRITFEKIVKEVVESEEVFVDISKAKSDFVVGSVEEEHF